MQKSTFFVSWFRRSNLLYTSQPRYLAGCYSKYNAHLTVSLVHSGDGWKAMYHNGLDIHSMLVCVHIPGNFGIDAYCHTVRRHLFLCEISRAIRRFFRKVSGFKVNKEYWKWMFVDFVYNIWHSSNLVQL